MQKQICTNQIYNQSVSKLSTFIITKYWRIRAIIDHVNMVPNKITQRYTKFDTQERNNRGEHVLNNT